MNSEIRIARTAAQIPGEVLCKRACISRTRLSEIERGYREPTTREEELLTSALQELVAAKRKVAAFAAEVGWPLGASG